MFNVEPRIKSEKEQDFSFIAYVSMDDLFDKLKLLNYEREFLSGLKIKPLHKYYFVVTRNPGEQFYLFSLLSAWLIRKTGRDFQQPQEDDDPNETVERILKVVKEISSSHTEFSLNKLKQGVGEHVVEILNILANAALESCSITLQKPKPAKEQEDEVEVIEDESEINLERVEEEMLAAYIDSDDENLLHLDDLQANKREIRSIELNSSAIFDEDAWRLEIERVLPKLKVTIKNDSRDWRTHFDQMKQYKKQIDDLIVPSKTQLEKLVKDITVTMEKVGSREKYLNRELESTLDEYRQLQGQLSSIRDKYKNLSGILSERNRELNKLNDRLETVKQQMEERGSSMTDGTPLVNIKKAIGKIKNEIVEMDVRIGVLECILLQAKIRDEKLLENEFNESVSVFNINQTDN